MQTTIHLEPSNPLSILAKKAFPDFKGRKVALVITDTEVSLSSYWNEGSRSFKKIVRLEDQATIDVPENGSWFLPEWNVKGGLPQPGFIVVSHNLSGYGESVTIYAHPENMPQDKLPEKIQFSWEEEVVLTATRSLKSSYAGISNYRFKEAYSLVGITAEQWEKTKQSLIERGFLTKAGAITNKARNAMEWKQLHNLKRS